MGYERDRGGARARGYSTRWAKASATFLQRNPYCRGCSAMGKQVKAELVDHVEPHKGDQRKFWDTKLWQPSCRWHHDVVKQALERLHLDGQATLADLWLDSAMAARLSRQRERKPIGPDGWSVEG